MWETIKLGDIGSFFYYRLNGHNRKEFMALKNIQKDFNYANDSNNNSKEKNANVLSTNVNPMENVGTKLNNHIADKETIDSLIDKFLSITKPLFEDEYEVKEARSVLDNKNGENVYCQPQYIEVSRENVNEDNAHRLNAQNISLGTLNERVDKVQNNNLHVVESIGGKPKNMYSKESIEPIGSLDDLNT